MLTRLLLRGRRRAGPAPRHQRQPLGRTVTVVDAGDLIAHLLTCNALDHGKGTGEYRALCGRLILPAALAEGGNRDCAGCRATLMTVPRQRRRP